MYIVAKLIIKVIYRGNEKEINMIEWTVALEVILKITHSRDENESTTIRDAVWVLN